jgi:hypothetical protein
MFVHHLVSAARGVRRTIPSLGLAAAVLTSTLGSAVPALAQGPIVHDHRMGGPPVARIQVNLKSVHIIDDRDWGKGEMDFYFQLTCFKLSALCLGNESNGLDAIWTSFSAGSGETHVFDQILPGPTPTNHDYAASVAGGYPLYAGQRYELNWGMNEKDSFTNWDRMGEGKIEVTAENGWGVGTYTMRSVHSDDSAGDYEISFEVRRMPLPDLRPVNIKVQDLPGSTKKHVCIPVQNVEPGAAGPFVVELSVDGGVPNDGQTGVPGLTPGDFIEACVDTEIAAGPHKLAAIVDLPNTILEYNEANNVYEQDYTAPKLPVATPTQTGPKTEATQTGSATRDGQVDLTISAIKVNGQAPDGKGGCKDGKNAVAVVVKNAGDEKADAVAVRLTVDGAEAGTQAVKGLEAGKQREVRFEDVRLKKGEHKLTASVDPKDTVAESKADNNELTVTVGCTAAN